MTAKPPLANAFSEFAFPGTPINEALIPDLAGAGFPSSSTTSCSLPAETHLAIAIARSCVRTDRAVAFVSLGKALTERMIPTTRVATHSNASGSGGKRYRQLCQFCRQKATSREALRDGTSAAPFPARRRRLTVVCARYAASPRITNRRRSGSASARAALGERDADKLDLIRSAKRIGLKARLVTGVDEGRMEKLPSPAIVRLSGGRYVYGGRGPSGLCRLVDPITHAATDLSLEDLTREAGGRALLITRRLGGAGVSPKLFGLRWFLPTLWRYRKPLGHVLAASLFIQIFALTTPLVFQVIVDKVLTHRGYETLFVMIAGLVVVGLSQLGAAISARLRPVAHHQSDRRRARTAPVRPSLAPSDELFRDPGGRTDRRSRPRA